MKDARDYRFDAAQVFDHFGGVHSVRELLASVGVKIQTKTLQKQRERGVIPPHVLASIVYAAQKTKIPIDLTQFLMERKEGE